MTVTLKPTHPRNDLPSHQFRSCAHPQLAFHIRIWTNDSEFLSRAPWGHPRPIQLGEFAWWPKGQCVGLDSLQEPLQFTSALKTWIDEEYVWVQTQKACCFPTSLKILVVDYFHDERQAVCQDTYLIIDRILPPIQWSLAASIWNI